MQKSTQRVSQASSSATKDGKLVAISDEAFALLLYNNYVEKWLKAIQREEQQWLETLASPQPGSGGRRKSSKEREQASTLHNEQATASMEDGAMKEWQGTTNSITW